MWRMRAATIVSSSQMSASDPQRPLVASPCVSICALDGDNVCIGCFRSGQEISLWGRLTPEQQREVLVRCQRRMQGELVPSITERKS